MTKYEFTMSKQYDKYCLMDDPYVADMDDDTFQSLLQLINLSEEQQ